MDIDQIKETISRGEIDHALALILRKSDATSSYRNKVIVISSRYYHAHRNFQKSLLTTDQLAIEQSKITLELLDLLDEINAFQKQPVPNTSIPSLSHSTNPSKSIRLVLDQPFNDFNQNEQQAILTSISHLLNVPNTSIQIRNIQQGSVILTIALPDYESQKLFWLDKLENWKEYPIEEIFLEEEDFKQYITQKQTTQRAGKYLKTWNILLIVSILSIGLLVTNFLTFKNLQANQYEKQILAQQNEHLSAQSAEWEDYLGVIRNPNTLIVRATGTALQPKARIQVYWNKNEQQAFIDLIELEPTPSGKQYQIWLDVEGVMVNAGLIDFDRKALQEIKFIENATSINITLEPLGGSERPTASMLVANALLS